MNNYSAVRRGIESYRVMYGGSYSIDYCCYIINHIVKTLKYSGVELYDIDDNIDALDLVYLDAYGRLYDRYYRYRYEFSMKVGKDFIYYRGLKIRHYNNTDGLVPGCLLHGYGWRQYLPIVIIMFELETLYKCISNIDIILMLLKLAGFEMNKKSIISILNIGNVHNTLYGL